MQILIYIAINSDPTPVMESVQYIYTYLQAYRSIV